MPKVAHNLDLMNNRLLRARLESISGVPNDVTPGRVYFDPILGRLVFGNANGDGVVNPTDRQFHTGTQLAATISDFDDQVRTNRLDQMANPAGSVSMAGQKLTNVADGVGNNDAVNKGQLSSAISDTRSYVDSQVGSVADNSLSDFAAPTADLSVGGFKLVSVANGQSSGDAVNKGQLDAMSTSDRQYTDNAVAGVADNSLSDWAVPTGDIAFAGYKLTGLGAGVGNTDAVTKGQLDSTSTADRQYTDDQLAPIAARSFTDFAAADADVDADSHKLVNLANGTNPHDGVNLSQLNATSTADRQYTDDQLSPIAARSFTDFAAAAADVDAAGHKVVHVANGSVSSDAVNKGQLDAALSDAKAYTDALATDLTDHSLSDFKVPTGDISFASYKLTNLAAPVVSGDAVNKGTLDSQVTYLQTQIDDNQAALDARTLDSFEPAVDVVNFGSQRAINVANGTDSTDAVNKGQLDGLNTSLTNSLNNYAARTLDEIPAPVADVTMAGYRLTNLHASQSPTDAVTRQELDDAKAGLDWKESVRFATTDPVTLSGLTGWGEGALSDGDRVLAMGQADGKANLIYVAHAGSWTVAADSQNLTSMACVFVEEGAQAGMQWRLATTGSIVVGTTSLSWTQFAAEKIYTASHGVKKVGLDFQLDDEITQKYVEQIGDGSTTSFMVSHNLDTRDVVVSVYYDADGSEVECDVRRQNTNAVVLEFAVAPANNSLRVVVIG